MKIEVIYKRESSSVKTAIIRCVDRGDFPSRSIFTHQGVSVTPDNVLCTGLCATIVVQVDDVNGIVKHIRESLENWRNLHNELDKTYYFPTGRPSKFLNFVKLVRLRANKLTKLLIK
ncbi:MAG: hypothetical protein SVO01_00325 [Thermotogota bacterium]|nr:hypothetical protein [Thermotogota bacterium]